jgi:glyoxylase I family protein
MWILNFGVHDLDKIAAQLQPSGIEVKIDPETYPIGRFARIHDPEGSPIEIMATLKRGNQHAFFRRIS